MENIRETTNKNRDKRLKYRVLALLMGVMFLCSIVCLAVYLWGLRRAEADVEAMRASYVSRPADGPVGETPDGQKGPESGGAVIPQESSGEGKPGEENPQGGGFWKEEEAQEAKRPDYGIGEKTVDIAALQEEVNGHIYAWISVPGTVIDYPVLQHPEEMDYYLEHNPDGTSGLPGGIYTQRMNAKDWTDPNTLIYGHNMRNGTMFADLHKFEDQDFFDENRYIHIYTESGEILVYEIFAAYVTDDRHQLMIWNLNREDGFQSYLDAVPEHTGRGCHFREDISPTVEDKLLTLSTCVSGRDNQRYLVQGVLIAREEQP